MEEREFFTLAEQAGFSHKQAEFMWSYLAKLGHEHTSEHIIVDTADGERLAEYIELVDERLSELEDEEESEAKTN